MSDIETAEKFVRGIGIWSRPFDSIVQVIADRDAAIRRQVAEEVLGKYEHAVKTKLCFDWQDWLKEMRREYAPQEKDVKTTTVFVNGGMEKHNAKVARRAKVEVLRDAYGAWLASPITSAKERIHPEARKYWDDLCTRHGIQPHEIEPRKVYTEADIKVECEDESINTWVIRCGDMGWNEDEWVKYDERDSSVYSKHDAEAIASHLRATGNVPEAK